MRPRGPEYPNSQISKVDLSVKLQNRIAEIADFFGDMPENIDRARVLALIINKLPGKVDKKTLAQCLEAMLLDAKENIAPEAGLLLNLLASVKRGEVI